MDKINQTNSENEKREKLSEEFDDKTRKEKKSVNDKVHEDSTLFSDYIKRTIEGGYSLKIQRLSRNIYKRYIRDFNMDKFNVDGFSSAEFIAVFYRATEMIKSEIIDFNEEENPRDYSELTLEFGNTSLAIRENSDDKSTNFYHNLNEEIDQKFLKKIFLFFENCEGWRNHIDLLKFSSESCWITPEMIENCEFQKENISNIKTITADLNKFFFLEFFWKPMKRFMEEDEKTKLGINLANSVRLLQEGKLEFKKVFDFDCNNNFYSKIDDGTEKSKVLERFFGKLSVSFRDYINKMINGSSEKKIKKYIEEFSPVYKNSVSEANIELSDVSAGEFIAVFFKLQEALHQRLDSQEMVYKKRDEIFNEKPTIEIKMGETKLTIKPRNEYYSVRIMFGLIKRGNEKAKKYTELYDYLNEYFKNTPEWEKKVLKLFLQFSSEGIPISTQDISKFENCRTGLPEIVDTLNELCFLAFFWEPMQWFDDEDDKFCEIAIAFAKSIKLLQKGIINFDFKDIFTTNSTKGLYQTEKIKVFKHSIFEKARKIDDEYKDEIDSSRNILNILESIFGSTEKKSELIL